MPMSRLESNLSTDASAGLDTLLAVAIGGTAHGSVGTSGDHDFIAVDLVAGQTYTFAMVGMGAQMLTDTILNLYAADGSTQLANNDDGLQNNNSVISYTASQTGRFYLDASGYGSETGSYGISASLGSKANFDAEMIAGVIDTHQSWSVTRGTGTNISFGFRDTVTGGQPNFSQFSDAEKATTRAVLAHFAEITNLTFTETTPGGYTNDATLLYANYSANDGAGAYGSYPGSRIGTAAAGDVWVNTATPPTTAPAPGSWFYYMMMHEIGHTMGLSHPGMYNAALGVSITYDANAQFLQDSGQYSVMSYFDATATGGPDANADTLMLYDIAALQLMYGANMTTRVGNTTYGFGANAGAVYDFARNVDPMIAIWDAGGIDTINASRYAANQKIDLHAGSYSNIGGMISNVAIAFGAVIERATGGRGADEIIGNAAANLLIGGDGDDTLSGEDGADLLYGGGGGDHLLGGAGNDFLQGDDPTKAGAVAEVFDLVATDYSAGNTLKINGVALYPTNSFTVEMIWQQNALVDQHYSMDIGNLSFYRYDNGEVALMFWGATTQSWNYGAIPSLMTDGKPHRISISYDDVAGLCKVYLDGTEAWRATFPPGTRALSGTGNIVFDDDASVGDVRIFDHARTAQEIWDNAWDSLADPTHTPGLLQNWVGDGTGHLVSALPGHADMISVGATTSGQASLWQQSIGNILEGGTGNDSYIVTTLLDQVIEAVGAGSDTVTARLNFSLAAGAEVEKLVVAAGVGAIRLEGNSFANAFVSAAGSDTLVGGGGNDSFTINGAGDVVIEVIGGGVDTIITSASYSLTAGNEIEYLRGSGTVGLVLGGNELMNRIYGTSGADSLAGGGGRDFLFGTTDAARDVFLFTNVTDSRVGALRDTIYNFASGVDVIDVSQIDSDAALAGDQSFIFTAGTAAAHAIWLIASAAGVILRGDVTGDLLADMEIFLAGTPSVTAADLLL